MEIKRTIIVASYDKSRFNDEVDSIKRDFRVDTVRTLEDAGRYLAYITYNYKYLTDNIFLDTLDLSTRLSNVLRRRNIVKLGELRHYFLTGELKTFRNIGKDCLEEVNQILNKYYKVDHSSILNELSHEYSGRKVVNYNRYIKPNLGLFE